MWHRLPVNIINMATLRNLEVTHPKCKIHRIWTSAHVLHKKRINVTAQIIQWNPVQLNSSLQMVGRPFTKLKTNIHPENNGKYIKTQNKYSIR